MELLAHYMLTLLCLLRYLSAESTTAAPVVKTNNGNVRGLTKQYPEGHVLQYIGIPFAAPPVGPFRFQKPRAHTGWGDILNATEFGPSCFQHLLQNDAWLIPNKNMSEDCLQLNIFIPHSINQSNPKTVMVWIHGGGFTAGQATLFDGSYLALTGDVIVVTVNYRLGLFGFLSTEDTVAPGNYGLWDQHMALKWVKENIVEFGGNPHSVCIFGESAGGYSVGLHTIAPVNRDYFQRAISESGTVLSPRALSTGARYVAFKAGALLKCTTYSSSDLIPCLQFVSPQELLGVQNKASESSNDLNFINNLGPVMDGDFITDVPNNILKNKHSPAYEMFKSVALMAGTNNAEGGLLYFSLKGFQEKFKFNISEMVPASVLCNLVAPSVARDYYNDSADVAKAICDEYTVTGSAGDQSRSIVDVYAHLQFVIPTILTNLAHAKTNNKPTYHYLFSHQPSFPWIQERPNWLKGANHAGEVPFVFGLRAMYKKTSAKPKDELILSRQMMIYWSNFAKTSDPNIPNTEAPTWPVFDTTERRFMNLNVDPRQGTKAFDEKYRFWTYLLSNSTTQLSHNVDRNNTNTTGGADTLSFDKAVQILLMCIAGEYVLNCLA